MDEPAVLSNILTEEQKKEYENYILGEAGKIITPARIIINVIGLMILAMVVWLYFFQKKEVAGEE